jgi:3-hydroxyisobutyrate dehydrogenase-like beta-hydroxyacid dehydrogenase
MIERVGIVGLGVMGSAMSGHLIDAGYTVCGYDIDADRVSALETRGGSGLGSATDVAVNADLVLFSLASVEALDQASAAVAEGAHHGLIAAEMGVLPIPAKEATFDRLSAVDVELMDVPVSGTGIQAADATLVVMASGSDAAFAATKPVFDVVGRATYHLGAFPNGSVMKFIANLLVSIHTLAAGEAHTLGLAAGMDPAVVQKVIADGVGSSAMFEIRGPMMVADVYEPPSARLDIIKKDAGIIQEFARTIGSPTPLLDTAVSLYEQASALGLGDLDAAAMCRFLEQTGNVQRRT